VKENLVPSETLTAFDTAKPSVVYFQTQKIPLKTFVDTHGLKAPDSLIQKLHQKGIKTIEDIRSAGGLSFRKKFGDSDRVIVEHLEAQARLLTLCPDATLNEKLIAKGYTSIAAVAHANPPELAAAIGQRANDPIVKELIKRGKAQHGLVESLVLGQLGNRATKFRTTDDRAAKPTEPDLPALDDVVSETCSCKDCDAAVSPRAYLADLMQYAIDHLRDGGQALDLNFFESHFYQPFGKLPANCLGMEEEVRQVRICIEVLRSYLGKHSREISNTQAYALKEAEQRCRLDVYQVILNKLGTNLTEMRVAQGASLEERKRIAERIGISEAALVGMYLDPTRL
jgi:hypothetical protein